MIITCPRCEKRFGVRDGLIPPRGRRAKCASCDEVFLARPSEGSAVGEPVHYEAIGMPGDGLASRISFVAPAAPQSIASQRAGSEKRGVVPVKGSPPVLVIQPPPASPGPIAEAGTATEETLPPKALHLAGEKTATGNETVALSASVIGRAVEAAADPEMDGVSGGEAVLTPDRVGVHRGATTARPASRPSDPDQGTPHRTAGGLTRALGIPFQGWGIILMQLYAALAVLAGINPLFACLLGGLLLVYTTHLLRVSARGEPRLPDWPAGREIPALLAGTARALAITLTAALPLILFNILMVRTGSGVPAFRPESPGLLVEKLGSDFVAGNLLLIGLYFFYTPMALGLGAALETLEPVFNPLMTIRAIVAHIGEYIPLVLGIATGLAAAVATQVALAGAHPVAATFFGGLVWGYVSLAGGCALGRMLQRPTTGRGAEATAA